MGTKLKDGTLDDACLKKLKPGERFFVLRAQDRLSCLLVRMWACLAWIMGCPPEKVDEAFSCAREMRRWPRRKFPD